MEQELFLEQGKIPAPTEVEDTGSGIAPDEVENLFEPLKLKRTKSRVPGLLGLPSAENSCNCWRGDTPLSSTLGEERFRLIRLGPNRRQTFKRNNFPRQVTSV